MSHYMTALAMKQVGLKPATKIVLYWLADHHNGESGRCFPSLQRLADVCEMSRRSVQNHLAELEEKNLIKVNTNFHNGQQTSNSYELLLEGVQNLHGGSADIARVPPQDLLTNLGSNNHVSKPVGKKAVTLPDNWVPNEKNLQDAHERGFTDKEIEHEAEQFRNYHHAKGSAFKSWDAAWRTWLGNARKFAQTSKSRASGATDSLLAGFAAYANRNN